MRIVDRKTFLAMPAGTIFAQGKQWYFGNLEVKGGTIGENDFGYFDPCWVDAHESGEAVARLDEMLSTGRSYPMTDGFGRDGSFEDDAIFMIFERDDLIRFRKHIDIAIKIQE